MNTIETIMTRTSIREFKQEEVPEEMIRKILSAGMAGPSCADVRDWSFIVVKNRDTLAKMAEANGPYAGPLKNAAFAVLVLGDLTRAFEPAPDYWVVDGSIAGQNMVLAARDLGIGSVWLGTWPEMERVEGQKEIFGLPDTQVPHSVIAFGFPDETPAVSHPDWEEGRVHYEKW